jgi:hypothetical protein
LNLSPENIAIERVEYEIKDYKNKDSIRGVMYDFRIINFINLFYFEKTSE